MGSATCAELARRGAEVIGLERFTIGHTYGSHAGQSRAFRLSYFEHEGYVPLLKRARTLWLELNAHTGREIYHQVGGVYLSASHADFVRLSYEAAIQHELDVELLDADAIRARFPVFHIPDHWQALVEAPAGFIVPEWSIDAYAEIARANGADLRTKVQVLGWKVTANGVRVDTTAGPLDGDGLVLAGGAWSQGLANIGQLQVRPSRQIIGWVNAPADAQIDVGRLGVWALELEDGSLLYGFPRMSGLPGPSGFKVARHWAGPTIDPDDLDRSTCKTDEVDFLGHLRRYLPSAYGEVSELQACVYGNSNDGHFRIGIHPESNRVVVAAGFSGHGLKFQPVIGEILADLALTGETLHNIDFISLD
jgi:sarcosine oxidase